MSWAMKALVLIRLDAREGAWITVDELAQYFECPPEQVRDACDLLLSEGEIEAAAAEGSALIQRVRTRSTLLHGSQA